MTNKTATITISFINGDKNKPFFNISSNSSDLMTYALNLADMAKVKDMDITVDYDKKEN